MEQGTPEWFAARAGKVTASRIKDVMAKIKTGEAATRRNYKAQLVAERLTGTAEAGFTNGAMQWGTDNEPIARATYETVYNVMVDQVGFVDHQTISMAGASPDGLIDFDGLIEIKCPNTATHIDYLLSRTIPSDYMLQIQWQLECTGRKWCDFVSFDPRMPENLRLLVIRVERDEKQIKQIMDEVICFLTEVNDIITQLSSMKSK